MIYDTLNNLPNYLGMSDNLDAVIEFIMARDINNLPAGKTRIDGEKAVVTVSTVTPQVGGKVPFIRRDAHLTLETDLEGSELFEVSLGEFSPTKPTDEAADLTVGSDVFLNCFALADLVVRAEPEAATGLFALVNNITEAVRALFWLPGEAAPRAGLWYPAYWEDVEESPAHILLHTFSGQGYHYRQCFLNGKFLCAEYDAIFPEGHAAEDRNIMAMLCFDRLRWPWNLTEGAKAAYTAFLKANTGRVVARLLKAQDLDGLKALLALDVLDAAAFAEAAQMAAKADNAAAAALLADAEYTKLSAKPKKKRYDFDF